MQFVFIGGCPRSGTTLLGSMLGNLDGCVATPESQFKTRLIRAAARHKSLPAYMATRMRSNFRIGNWSIPRERLLQLQGDDCESYFTALLQAFGERHGQTVDTWIDHTPNNLRYAEQMIAAFPGVRFVHIVRDGRANAASILPLDWGPNDIIRAARWWRRKTSDGLIASRRWPQRVYRVRYEELVREPAPTCQALCTWLGLTYRPDMHTGTRMEVPEYTRNQHALVGRPPDPSSIDRWQSSLSTTEIRIFEWYARDLLEELGYALRGPNPPQPPTPWERFRYGSYRDWLYMFLYNKWRRVQRKRRARAAPGGAVES